MENVFYLNKKLQPEDNPKEVVAIAHFFREENSGMIDALTQFRFKKNVEITFFTPIGYNADRIESNKLQKEWGKEHYPQYHSFLPSEKVCNLIREITNRKFDNCWTRSYGDDGYPRYRRYSLIMKNGFMYLGDIEDIAEYVDAPIAPPKLILLVKIFIRYFNAFTTN